MGARCSVKECAAAKAAEVGAVPCISLERAQMLSGNPSMTAARYHAFGSGRSLQDDYVVHDEVLGVGICGEVVVATGKDRRRYALKRVSKSKLHPAKLQQLIAEVEIYLCLDHPNIARLHDVYETATEMCLLTECCEGGELYFRLQKRGVYTDADAADATRQMLRAVAYLHKHNVVHRDLKLENFLCESEADDGKLKLIDFGFAKIWDPSTLMLASCGSIAYVSPDVLNGQGYTNRCDLWSLGVIIWMLLVGYPPFHGLEQKMMAKIREGTPDWNHKRRWDPVSQDAVDLIKKMLQKDPSLRPTAQEALKHPWLDRGPENGQRASLSRDALRSMQHYAGASKARRAMLQLLAQELAPEETQELRETFLAIDRSGQGTISLQDLKDAIRSSGSRSPNKRQSPLAGPSGARCFSRSETESPESDLSQSSPSAASSPTRRLRRSPSGDLGELFSRLAASGDEQIYYSDFLAATLEARSLLREEAVRAAFRRLDADDSGSISLADFRAVLGNTFEGTNVEQLVAEVDPGGSGEISFDAFVRVLEDHDEVPSPRRRGGAAAGISPGFF